MSTPEFREPASIILWRFLGLLDRIYGMHSDCSGIELWKTRLTELTIAKGTDPSTRLFMGAGDPNRVDAPYTHSATIGEVIDRNGKDGENQLLLSQACLVFVYTVWDTSIRPAYAQSLGKDQKEVRSDVLGDLRLYRHGILHNNSVLERQTEKLDFVRIGDRIELRREQMDRLFTLLFDDISEVNRVHTGEQLNLSFERRLNAENHTSKSEAKNTKGTV